MTLHPDEQARERFEAWWWKRHPDYTSELLKRTSKSGAYDSNWVNGMWLAWKAAGQEARLTEAEWWHMQRGHHGANWCCERIDNLRASKLAAAAAQPGDTAAGGER